MISTTTTTHTHTHNTLFLAMASHTQGEPPPFQLAPADWERRTLRELKALCSKHHLPTRTHRKDLIAALEARYAEQRALSENGGKALSEVAAPPTVPRAPLNVAVSGWEQPTQSADGPRASVPLSTTHLGADNPFAALTDLDSSRRPLLAAKRATGQASATSHLSRLRSACSRVTARHLRKVGPGASSPVTTIGNPTPSADDHLAVSVTAPTRTRHRQALPRSRGARRTASMSPEPKTHRSAFYRAPDDDQPTGDQAPNDQAPSTQVDNDKPPSSQALSPQAPSVRAPDAEAPRDAPPPVVDDTTMADAPPQSGDTDANVPRLPVYPDGEPLPSIEDWQNLTAKALENLCQAHGLPGSHRWPKPALAQHLRKRSEERRVGKECRSRWSPYH